MMHIPKGRYAAQIKGDFVVFLIGMRINRLLLPHKWLPITFAMSRMLKELAKNPELGMLHAQTFVSGRTVLVVQYWRSFDQLHAYAHSKNLEHLPAWTAFNRKVGGLNQQRSYWDSNTNKDCLHWKSQTLFSFSVRSICGASVSRWGNGIGLGRRDWQTCALAG